VSVAPFDRRYPAEFVTGYHRAVHVGAALVLLGALISVATVRKLEHEGHAAAEPAIGARRVPEKRKTPGCGSGGRFLLGDSALCGGLRGTWLCGPATPLADPTW
jgi:hypothetical protein